MAEWLCSGLQNRGHRFNSGPGLHEQSAIIIVPDNQTSSRPGTPFRHGIVDGFGIPGWALMGTMVGFGAIAKDAGFSAAQTIVSTFTIWGMPGQVAMASLYASGSSLFVIFTAVALANMRMMLMAISGADMLALNSRQHHWLKKVLFIQFMAISGWAQISYKQPDYTPDQLRQYYAGFCVLLFTGANIGTTTGFFLDQLVPPHIQPLIIFITPIYILLLLVNARVSVNKHAAACGGVLAPALYPVFADWSILISGLAGGTLAVIYLKLTASRGRS